MRKLFVLIFLTLSVNVLASEIRLISVTGVVEKSVQPDIVRININVWGKGESAKKAQLNSANQNDILKKSLEFFKVKSTEVKTTSYNLNPEYVYDEKTNKNNITGFTAAQDLVITLRKLDDAGPFIDSLTSASKSIYSGVSVNSLGFDIEKRLEAENALLGDAVRVAEAQAEVLAKASNVKLKGIYRLAPRGSHSITPMYEVQNYATTPRAKNAAATTFMQGEVKIVSEVSADYLIE